MIKIEMNYVIIEILIVVLVNYRINLYIRISLIILRKDEKENEFQNRTKV